MHASDRALQCMRAATISTAFAATVLLPPLLAAADAGAAVITKCPTTASLKASAGTSLTVKTNKIDAGDVVCDYSHALPNYKQYNVSIAADAMQYSDSAFVNIVKSYAKNLNAPLVTLKGVGDEAWEYTEKSDATTTVTIVVGKREVTVIGNVPARNVLAVAKKVS